MDSEEDKTEENNRTSQPSSIQSFYPKHTQQSPKRSRTSSYNDRRVHVSERSFLGSVPLDLAWEILSRLPAKSIVRFRSVCKLWSSITTTPDFVNQFPALYSASRPCVLLIFGKGETRIVFSLPQHQNPVDPYSQVERYEEVINPNHPKLAYTSDSVHGLICFKNSKQLVIWNPTIRQFFTLPKPGNSLRHVGGILGYDPVECKYKVLSFLTEAEIHVLTLGAQESWRIIKASPMHRLIPTKSNAVCINGILYYKAEVSLASTLKHAIMSFDLRFETFSLIEFPRYDNSQDVMVSYEGRLALVRSMAYAVNIWILEDAENQKWSYKHFHYPPSHNIWMALDFKGVTDAGELVYTPRVLYESFCVVYFDPKRKSIRETMFEGIANKEFRQLKGLGFRQLDNLVVLPNHIESLFSL